MKVRVASMVVAVLTLMAVPSYAQTVTGGVKVGVNFADVAVDEDAADDSESIDTKTGFVVGGFVEVPVNEVFSFQPEVLFTQKGATVTETFEDDEFEFDVNINMIQIPLLAKFSVPAGGLRPFVVVGPGFGFKVSAEYSDEDTETDADDDFKSFETSLIVGGGVHIGPASVEVRYDHGLTNLSDSDEDVKSRTFSILVGFGFGR